MKKLLISLTVALLIASPTFSQGLKYFPNETSEITVYDFQSHSLKLGLRYPALSWRGLLYFDGALITDFDSLDVAGGLSLDLINFGKLLGLEVYLSSNVVVGFCGGYNFSREKALYGIYSGVKWSW